MEEDMVEEFKVPLGTLTSLQFTIATEQDRENQSVLNIQASGEVTDSRLGIPNPASKCTTCGSESLENCEGHFGIVKFPYTLIHPYYLSEVAKILNKVCPNCKCIRRELIGKVMQGCKYCRNKNSWNWYPPMTFRVSSKEIFRKTTIIVEVREAHVRKMRLKGVSLPADYWDFVPTDTNPELDDSFAKPNRRVLTHTQVHDLLSDIDPEFIKRFISVPESVYLDSFPITPNNHRVTELMQKFSNGQRLIFDDRTRAFKKIVDFRGTANELSSRVLDCLKISKIHSDKDTTEKYANPYRVRLEGETKMSGLRYLKDVILSKRNNSTFRTVVIGDPNLKINEVGIPCHMAEKLLVSEIVNKWNWERMIACCDIRILEKGEVYLRRKDAVVHIRKIEDLKLGDTVSRPLIDGDIVMINRPPSIHQHSLIGLSVKVLPISSVVAINPLICSPLCGDFDGDCLHGYIPQSLETQVELTELVGLEKQLINGQSGKNLLSFGQDSLAAAFMLTKDGEVLNRHDMQQLAMFCPYEPPSPAIVKAARVGGPHWTGKQLFSMLLPPDLDCKFQSCGVHVKNGELIYSSEWSSWLRDGDENIFHSLVEHHESRFLDILSAGQEVLCEWLSMRGLSVSLLDLFITHDPKARRNLMDEISYGLRDVEEACNLKQLMVESCRSLLAGEDDQEVVFDVERMCYDRQRFATLNQVSVDAFKHAYRDVLSLAYKYAGDDNSLLDMSRAGSKGNTLKLAQQSLCLGLQHSLVPLSFRFPHQLSCEAWNNHKMRVGSMGDADETTKRFIPYAVVKNSFITGLNPAECFVHSTTSRNTSFSENADLPGTLSRRLFFMMRDLYEAYDGTVRNLYGNHVVQFSYNNEGSSDSSPDSMSGIGGQPVGSLSACAISEAAYSALDQPVSLLEASPLLNLKNILECGSKKGVGNQTVSLYLAPSLGKHRHGFEYGALAVKSHLDKLDFSDIVSTSMIFYSPAKNMRRISSPWVCHFHISKELITKRRLDMQAITTALYDQYLVRRKEVRAYVADLKITLDGEDEEFLKANPRPDDTVCIAVEVFEIPNKAEVGLKIVRGMVMPFLLRTVVQGVPEVKKVDILWNEFPKVPSASPSKPSGELYLKVHMCGDSKIRNYWNALMDDCLPIMDLIDWTRTHPDNIRRFTKSFGIVAAQNQFLDVLQSAIGDTGKKILPQHLNLVANCLSVTGEFVSLNSKGLSLQRHHATAPSPFSQACLSNPSTCFIKAAKAEVKDELQGTIDALAWGKMPSLGTGGHFDILFSVQDEVITKPIDIYDMLSSTASIMEQQQKTEVPISFNIKSDKGGNRLNMDRGFVHRDVKKISKSYLKSVFSVNDIQKLSHTLKMILLKYPIDQHLNETDRKTLMMALYFHPQRDAKMGTGARHFKVGYHPIHKESRCFHLVRDDESTEDFSYHKCIIGALEIIAPGKADGYKARMLRRQNAQK